MNRFFAAATVLIAGVPAMVAGPQPAHAIRCAGIVQINKTTRIITPYCQHEELARVARSYGINTSGRRLRNNINHKAKICEAIGHDIRIGSVCGGLRRQDRGGGRVNS